jgi:hypothetical protein
MRTPETSETFRESGASLVTDPRVEVAPTESGRPAATTLLERNYAGLTVEISYHQPTEALHLFVQLGEDTGKVCTIQPHEVLEAFEHPYIYLQRAGLA